MNVDRNKMRGLMRRTLIVERSVVKGTWLNWLYGTLILSIVSYTGLFKNKGEIYFYKSKLIYQLHLKNIDG